MVTKRRIIRPESSRKLRAIFLLKAAGALCLLYLIGYVSNLLPPIALVLVLAIISSATAISFAYPYVVKRINTQNMFKKRGRVARFINGRVLLLVGCFVLSLALMLGLLVEIQKWEWLEWGIAILSIPLYLAVSILTRKKVSEEYKDEFQTRGTVLWSWGVTGIVLLVVYLVVFTFSSVGQHASVGESLSATKLLFADSPSALLVFLGRTEYVLDGITSFGLSQAQQFSFALGLIIRAVMCASAAFGLAHVLSFCSLRVSDLKLVFLPLGEMKYSPRCLQTVCKAVVSLVAASLCLVFLFICADTRAERVYQDNGFAQFNSGVREMFKLTAYEFDGKYYDAETIEKTVDSVSQENPESRETLDSLKKDFVDFYDSLLINVDSYLDWYYSPASFLHLKQRYQVENSDGIHEQFMDMLMEGVTDESLRTSVAEFNELRGSLESGVEERLTNSNLNGIPEWAIAKKVSLSDSLWFKKLDAASMLYEPEGDNTNRNDRDEYRNAIKQAIQNSRDETLLLNY